MCRHLTIVGVGVIEKHAYRLIGSGPTKMTSTDIFGLQIATAGTMFNGNPTAIAVQGASITVTVEVIGSLSLRKQSHAYHCA